ncbi:MAG: FIST C-terminal domain-containing protein [Planctomycetes bacterium]|nr:FIST C-terminal domain-containing protein [Planctomycetota bacterium]
MPYAAHCSQTENTSRAIAEVAGSVAAQLGGTEPDLSFLFATRDHIANCQTLAQQAAAITGSKVLLGCTGESIATGGVEIESGSALSMWSAVLPGAELEPFHVTFEQTPDGPICSGFPESTGDSAAARAVFLLADPFSCAIDALLDRFADEWPGFPVMGGMASGASAPSENRLFYQNSDLEQGAVGVIIRKGPQIQSVVSQGCRPIGLTFIVTKVQDNVVLELGGKTALSRLEQTYAGLSEDDRHLIRKGLHLGVVMDEHKPVFTRGDFLISNVLGADRESGAIAIGNYVRVGQTVQFHVRDSETADEDLRHLLTVCRDKKSQRPGGALLFSCNGRGTRLFSQPNHDAGVIQELCGPLPLAGFFAQGELGPVGGRNYIHGFTASVALFD